MAMLTSHIVFAGLVPHPPIIVPEVGCGREAGAMATVRAMKDFARRFVATKPERLILISPHAPRRSRQFGLYRGLCIEGNLAEFGAGELILRFDGDESCRGLLHREGEKVGLAFWEFPESSLDHGAMVPLSYLWRAGWRGRLAVIGLNYPGEGQLVELGECLARVADRLGGRVAIVASGDMSHRLTPNAPGGYNPEGARFDAAFVDRLRREDYRGMASFDRGLQSSAGEDVLDSTLVVLSAIGFEPREAEVLSYEGPFGVGYCVAVFSRESDEEVQAGGRELLAVARLTLEDYVRRGTHPGRRHVEGGYLARKAGAFVTIRLRDGSLRGCIGTLEPTKVNLVDEVSDRAVAVARWAYGGPVREDELPNLVYEVSVLSEPEPVLGEYQLCPDIYGVIVRDEEGRRAVLLPGIASIRSVEDQVRFVIRKAGIPEGSSIKLQRFTTDHFEEKAE